MTPEENINEAHKLFEDIKELIAASKFKGMIAVVCEGEINFSFTKLQPRETEEHLLKMKKSLLHSINRYEVNNEPSRNKF